ncbi:MAG: tRNA lysidine(34) synthetase TilS [Anaerolineae bacterium]
MSGASDAIRQQVWLRVQRAFDTARAAPASAALFSQHPTPIILAVSGGPDSLCLADTVLSQVDALGLLPAIAHLDHGLRGEASRADAEFTRAFASARSAPFFGEQADVASLANAARLSIEVAARRARYDFLARAAYAFGASLIALAHHADDQAETVLLRLIRGTGLTGLRGMQLLSPHPSARGLYLIRPLLQITHAEVLAYCQARQLEPRLDETNASADHLRNRVRRELLPLLEQYNPGIRAVLARLAEIAAGDAEIVAHAAEQALAQLIQPQAQAANNRLTLDRAAWRALPTSLQRATLRQAVQRLRGDLTDLKLAAVEEARDVLNSDAPSGVISLRPNARIEVWPTHFTCVIDCAPAEASPPL